MREIGYERHGQRMQRRIHCLGRRAERNGYCNRRQLAAPRHACHHPLNLRPEAPAIALGRQDARDGGQQVQQVADFERDRFTRCTGSVPFHGA